MATCGARGQVDNSVRSPAGSRSPTRASVAGCSSGVLDVLIEPRHFFPEDVFDGLLAAIAVGFEGEEDEPRDAAVAADGLVHAVALYGEGAVVVVGFAVDQ